MTAYHVADNNSWKICQIPALLFSVACSVVHSVSSADNELIVV